LLFTALPFTFDGVTPAVSKAHAIIGRPGTPMSFAGVHRRAVRRTFGVGANLGYRGVYHRNFGPYAYHRHPVARAAVYGATAYGAGWGGGWGSAAPGWGVSVAPGWGGGWGWNLPLFSAAPGWGVSVAPGWGGGWGWNRPLFRSAPGWGGGWGGWGNRRWGW
jgi:hypothetical protein